MARNKYPEQTIERILDLSTKLFLEKGYKNTSIQDILDNPKFLAIQLKEVKTVVTPKFIFPIIEEGVQDNSIQTTYPYEIGEAITLLLNIVLTPLFSVIKLSNSLLQNAKWLINF